MIPLKSVCGGFEGNDWVTLDPPSKNHGNEAGEDRVNTVWAVAFFPNSDFRFKCVAQTDFTR